MKKEIFVAAISVTLAACSTPKALVVDSTVLGTSTAQVRLEIPAAFKDYYDLGFDASVTFRFFEKRGTCPDISAEGLKAKGLFGEAVLNKDLTTSPAMLPADRDIYAQIKYQEQGISQSNWCANGLRFMLQANKRYVLQFFPTKTIGPKNCVVNLLELVGDGDSAAKVPVTSVEFAELQKEPGLFGKETFGKNLCN